MKNLAVVLVLLAGFPTLAQAKSAYRCDVYEDSQGLTHVKAADEVGTFACMGYLHARDRAWQMDYFRRLAQGRTAEILGFDSLRTDFFMRILGLSERAEGIARELSAESVTRFQAYADGVNFILKDSQAYEFKKLGYRPEPWAVADSIAVLLLEAFEQTRESFEVQFRQQAWLDRLGPDASSLFGSDGLPWDTSILKEGEFLRTPATKPKVSRQAFASADGLPPRLFGPESGSNNWVVDANRTANGHSLLANDPHLDIGHPPFWHHVHVQGGALNAIGAALPGIPQIVSGANEHVSWGLTNSYLTVSRVSYIAEADLEKAQTFRPTIKIKLGPFQIPFIFKTFRRTANGWPILPLKAPKGQAVLLRWSGFDLSAKELEPLNELMLAKNASELDADLAATGLPSWNFVFADTKGAIGYRAIGRVPKMLAQTSFGIPVEKLSELGTSASFPSVLDVNEMPHLFNPKRGFVVTANNRQWAPGASVDPGWVQASGFRAFRIEEMIARGENKHDVASFSQMQCDHQVVDARFTSQLLVGKLILTGSVLDKRELAAVHLLQGWDYNSGLDCQACGVYRRWTDRLVESIQGNKNLLYRLAALPRGAAPELEKVLKSTLTSALDDLGVSKSSPEFPAWSELHRAYFHHLAGDHFPSDGYVSTPGDANAVNVGAGTWVPGKHGKSGYYDQDAAASQRLVVEMSSPPVVYSVLAGPNADTASPDLNQPNGPWMNWRNCQLMKREFPLDWSSVQTTAVEF